MAGLAVVLLVALLGTALGFQGWKSRVPTFDMHNYIWGARDLVTTGALPQYGDIGSHGAQPPGTAWLLVPGLLAFTDPRLFEVVGAAGLYVATLLGVFVLARTYFGTPCALVSVVVYGLSELGIFVAGSLYPIGHPFFYVWTFYCAGEWVRRRNAAYLAFAGAIWAVGMYVDMAIAPAAFILPVLWILYRPPVRLWPLLGAGLLALVVWFPYLRYEGRVGFADLQSIVSLQNVPKRAYRHTWCDPGLPLRRWQDTSGRLDPNTANLTSRLQHMGLGPLRSVLRRGRAIVEGLSYNFDRVPAIPGARLERSREASTDIYYLRAVPRVPGLGLGLMLLGVISLALLNLSRVPGTGVDFVVRHGLGRKRLAAVGMGLAAIGIVASEFLMARYLNRDSVLGALTITSVRQFQVILALGGVAILMRKRLAAVVGRLAATAEPEGGRESRLGDPRLLAIGLAVPWVILLFVAEPGRSHRFWWLWPLQAIVLAASVTHLPARLEAPRRVAWIGSILLAAVLVGNPFLVSRLKGWRETGWAGTDAAQIQAIDYIGGDLRSMGADRAAIGYQIFLYSFMPRLNDIDSRYKVGADFNLLFTFRQGISNTNGCVEGVSPEDRYRIVEPWPREETDAPRFFVDVPLGRDFRLMRQFGPYQVFKR